MLSRQKHNYVGRILKKSLQGSIHAQFYMAIKGPFGRFLLQPCTVSIKRCKNKFSILRRYGILVKASPDRRVRKREHTYQLVFVAQAFVAYSSKCNCCTHRRIHQTRHSCTCHNQQAFWRTSVNGHRCPQKCKVNRRSI